MSCLILFPNQLFEDKYIKMIFKEIEEVKISIILWEHDYFFREFPYHKLKLAFHRASMKNYYDDLKYNKIYIENKDKTTKIKNFMEKNKLNQIIFFNPIEKKLIKLIDNKKLIPKTNFEFIIFPSPYFLNSTSFEKIQEIEDTLTTTRHDLFYKSQRIKYDIMVKKTNNKITPEGNSWSFDTENRKPFEKNQEEIELLKINKNKKEYITEAINYINKNFNKHYGLCEEENFIYPISRTDALKWIDDFILRKLNNFGKYEDAFSSKVIFGYHSVLSPLTNIGIITPRDILNKVENYKKNIASKEGFIRQLIGWREYCYYIYEKFYDKLTTKIFYHKSNQKIPKKFWEGNTKIPVIDNIILHINKYAYSHHIERLMCIGNFLLLIGIKPIEIYNWFQTMYIDAYDVFMIPNVYGMLLYGFNTEETHMMTRPYFCSSNYLMKMSDFKTQEIELDGKNYKWNEIMDSLYYKLINDYSKEFSKIYSTANAVKRFNDFTNERKKNLLKMANDYIDWLFN
jgi:deoxyribodipyrimidine photolyase-related protein